MDRAYRVPMQIERPGSSPADVIEQLPQRVIFRDPHGTHVPTTILAPEMTRVRRAVPRTSPLVGKRECEKRMRSRTARVWPAMMTLTSR